MTAQPNDRAADLVAQSFMGGAEPCEGAWSDATAALAAIRDALARGGDDADAIAQAIGLGRQEGSDGWFPGRRICRYVSEWRGVES